MRPRLSEWHADAAWIDDTNATNHAIEWHVGVPAHDQSRIHASSELFQPLVGRLRGHHLLVAARRSVTEERAPKPVHINRNGLSKRGQKVALVSRDLRRAPIIGKSAVDAAPPVAAGISSNQSAV